MKKVLITIIVIAVVILGIVMIKKQSASPDTNSYGSVSDTSDTNTLPVDNQQSSSTTVSTQNSTSTTSSGSTTFTLAQVATHNTESNCYSTINGQVYNLTAWINKHPGGDRAILSICGKDGSAAFNGQHGGQSRPEQILAGFEVGALAQ